MLKVSFIIIFGNKVLSVIFLVIFMLFIFWISKYHCFHPPDEEAETQKAQVTF